MDEGNHMIVIKPGRSAHDLKVEGNQIYIFLQGAYRTLIVLNASNVFTVCLCFFLFFILETGCCFCAINISISYI